jgi:catechol 2,3-dioxygenase-like lactoylglutathione lyase family enzyme
MTRGMAVRPGLGHLLSGVQHVGVTVDDLAKSVEFYVDVLGGRLALSGDGFDGETLHQTLFQRECLDAAERGAAARSLGVASVRDGAEKLDVRLVSFGSTLVELLHFRDAKLSPTAPGALAALPSGVGFNAAVHICFGVKEEIDLNQFALDLEAECRARGIAVSCNRTVAVRSEAERRGAPARYAANKFWNDPRYPVEGAGDESFGDFQGLGFVYCKGPNGEQLEFAQATRKAKDRFQQAQTRYAAETQGAAVEGP